MNISYMYILFYMIFYIKKAVDTRHTHAHTHTETERDERDERVLLLERVCVWTHSATRETETERELARPPPACSTGLTAF